MEQAATLIAEMKTMAAGNATAMAMLEKQEAELKSMTLTTPKDLIKLIEALKKELQDKKASDFNYDFFQKVDSTIAEIELRYNFLKEEEKKELEKEIGILYITLSKVDDTFVRESILSIKALTEKDEDYTEDTQKAVKKIVEKVEECFEVIKNIYAHFDNKGNFSVDKKWTEFKKELEDKKAGSRIDLGESKTIDFDLRVLHYKGKLHFDKKEDLISEIEKEVKKEFTEVINDIGDVKDFAKEWKTSVDKKLSKKIEKIFKKEGKKEKEEYLLAFPVVFKKVSEDGSEGWVFDKAKTIAPAKTTSDNDASLSTEATINIDKAEFKKGVFTSRLVYHLDLTRAKFNYKKPDLLKLLIALGIVGVNAGSMIDEKTKTSKVKIEATDITEVLTETQKNISENIKEQTAKSTTAEMEITMELESSSDGTKVEITYQDNLGNIEFKKIHKYEPNLSESASAFEAKVAQQIK